jgi:hypothetical protein
MPLLPLLPAPVLAALLVSSLEEELLIALPAPLASSLDQEHLSALTVLLESSSLGQEHLPALTAQQAGSLLPLLPQMPARAESALLVSTSLEQEQLMHQLALLSVS